MARIIDPSMLTPVLQTVLKDHAIELFCALEELLAADRLSQHDFDELADDADDLISRITDASGFQQITTIDKKEFELREAKAQVLESLPGGESFIEWVNSFPNEFPVPEKVISAWLAAGIINYDEYEPERLVPTEIGVGIARGF